MGFSVEYPTVLPIRVRNLPLGVLVRMDHVCVLEHLGEEEGLLEIGEGTAVGSVNIGNGAVSATNASGVDDCFKARERPLDWGYQCCNFSSEKACVVQVGNLHLGTCGRRWRGRRNRKTPAPPGAGCRRHS
jgi:hypothetical protein